MKKILIALSLLLLMSCASTKESAHAYFRQKNTLVGIESTEQVLERLEQQEKMRAFIYEGLSSARVLQCTILRNQLYVAAKKGTSGSEGKEIATTAARIEKAYQENDKEFLFACEQVLNTPVGKRFWSTAEFYLRRRS